MSRAQSQSDPGYTIRPPGAPPTGELRWFFRPFPSLPEKWRSPLAQDQLLSEYLSDHTNFAHFATTRGLTVDQLYDWLHSEQVMDRRKRMEHLAQERADLLARLARPAAIESLLRLIQNRLLQPNQHRLAACCLIRAAESADHRDQRAQSRHPVPLAACCQCPASPTSPPRDPASTAVRTRVPPVSASPDDQSSPPTSILARIGAAGSPIPPRSDQPPRQTPTPGSPRAPNRARLRRR